VTALALTTAAHAQQTEDVPDALSVEWQGTCEKLHEDDQIRILRCSFPPGSKHVRHQHPANFVYTLSGGKLNTESASGTREAEVGTDAYVLNKPIPWHEEYRRYDGAVPRYRDEVPKIAILSPRKKR